MSNHTYIIQRPLMPTVQIQYRWVCEECGKVDTIQTYDHEVGTEIPRPYIPFGWQSYGHKLFCEKHELVVTAKDK